uniref:Uncharacterized protein n=1 Tax=Chlamydomonas leiostraca TaxID=1034604 RepID=A0A7S0S2R7_9CHLO|mmetsp:Transcript_4876/g.11937  ORF Transcript_4876/g.11937 Transcript_4876/m.11937 type:complete len:173 (+) Transcript_4876:247-765(+)|eukprot:CAMPEP_0202867790 /NCGR_PEP_ID=MMETSP1391-20130828/9623_1 /ASSEMBLY_ACC=CAM_ASM_000867 /TAXON_ID=1034604 /ORGANISM="Chlamydomonas leiostraca, Strain SAG 11-49" /LENGTH=172 /DNA_ID=CAMNT_0049547859 /DNA_START=227 /DNA_END=745 /DNA_ORIENTATION=+
MGALVRYAAAPVLLFPLVLPWLVIASIFAGASLLQGLVGYGVDLVVIAAELLRQNRPHIEAGASWAAGTAYKATSRYGVLLLRAHAGTEALIEGVGLALLPAWRQLLARFPLLAWLVAPAAAAVRGAGACAEAGYAFVHDEIVPVALDLAERLPLMEELLLKYAYRNPAAPE